MKAFLVADSEDHITESAVSASATKVVPAGSVLAVTRSGILRRTFPVAVTASAVAINQDLKALRPATGVDPKYIAWYLRRDEQSILHDCSKDGTTVDSIDFPALLKRQMPIAPHGEQERIVAAIEEQFSRLDAGVAALERAGQNLKRMRTAVLAAATSGSLIDVKGQKWEEVALGDLLDDIHAGKSFKCDERPSNTDQWGIVKVSAMTWGEFQEGENKTVTGDRAVDPRFEIRPGDLLVSRANTVDYVGAAVLVRKCRPRLLLSDKSLRLVPNARVLPEWLLISLRTPSARRYIESVATGTSDSMRNISQPKLKALKIVLPPIDVQEQLVAEVDRMMSQVEQLEKSLAAHQRSTQVLRSSILAAAFSGRLTAQNRSDEPASELLQRIAAETAASSNSEKRARGRKPRILLEEVMS